MTLSPLEPARITARPAATPAPVPQLPSRLERALDHCAARGVHLLITAPTDPRMSAGLATRFPTRRIAPGELVQWDTDYRVFCARSREPHDRGSWRILAVADDRVIGAVTARFFTGGMVNEYLHTRALLEQSGPVMREHCERAIAEAFAASQRTQRTFAEISHWAVEPGPGIAWIADALARAMGALISTFETPLLLLAADHRRGEVPRLMRLGAAPLGCAGKFALPPFVHHATGAWLRLLLLDTGALRARVQGTSFRDVACLRERLPIVSPH